MRLLNKSSPYLKGELILLFINKFQLFYVQIKFFNKFLFKNQLFINKYFLNMKKFYKTSHLRESLKLIALLLLFFTLSNNVNAQVMSVNKITPPSVVTGTGSLNPDVIVGSTVIVTDAGGSTCQAVTYEWISATNEAFTENVVRNLATTKDYDPSVLTTTTWFRRIASAECTNPDRSASSATGGIKITIY